MTVQPDGQFEYDTLHDKLPTVSWLMTSSGKTEQPIDPPLGRPRGPPS